MGLLVKRLLGKLRSRETPVELQEENRRRRSKGRWRVVRGIVSAITDRTGSTLRFTIQDCSLRGPWKRILLHFASVDRHNVARWRVDSSLGNRRH